MSKAKYGSEYSSEYYIQLERWKLNYKKIIDFSGNQLLLNQNNGTRMFLQGYNWMPSRVYTWFIQVDIKELL